MLRGSLQKRRADGKDIGAKRKDKNAVSEMNIERRCDRQNSTARRADVDTGGCGKACMALDVRLSCSIAD